MMVKQFHLKVLLAIAYVLSACTEDDGQIQFEDASNLRLKSISSYTNTDPNQIFTIDFNYDGNGRLIKTVANSLGSTADIEYDAIGRVIQVGDYEYIYNNENNIEKIENDNLIVASGTYDGTTIAYTDGRITSITDSYAGISQNRINTTNIAYDNRGQLNLYTRTIKDVDINSGQEFIIQLDRASFTYDADGNINEIISEQDYDSGNAPIFNIAYGFDNYNNPAQLILKTMGISEDYSLILLRAISEKNYFNVGTLFTYFKHNMVSYNQIPQTNDPAYWDLRFSVAFEYNEYGFPVSAVETQSSVNGNFEILTFFNWEYEEY